MFSKIPLLRCLPTFCGGVEFLGVDFSGLVSKIEATLSHLLGLPPGSSLEVYGVLCLYGFPRVSSSVFPLFSCYEMPKCVNSILFKVLILVIETQKCSLC